MAAFKSEVPISQLMYKIGTKVTTAMYMFSRTSYPMGLSKMLYEQTGSEKVQRLYNYKYMFTRSSYTECIATLYLKV